MHTKHETLHKQVGLAGLILGPVLLLIAQFFWKDGLLYSTAGWIQVLAFVCWVPAFKLLFDQFKEQAPVFAVLGFWVAVYGCFGGSHFGMEGLYNEVFSLTEVEAQNEVRERMGTGGIFALYLPGLLYPLSIIVLGVQFLRKGLLPGWLSILIIVVGVGFPLSRMPRIDWLAHLDNVLMGVTFLLVAMRLRNS